MLGLVRALSLAGVEGTGTQDVNTFKLRHARSRGLAKTRLEHLVTAALTVARLAAWFAERPAPPAGPPGWPSSGPESRVAASCATLPTASERVRKTRRATASLRSARTRHNKAILNGWARSGFTGTP